jgi:hypothetical protein
VLLVANVPLLFEHPELRSDRGIAGAAGELAPDLTGGRAPEAVQSVHNLPFALREQGMDGAASMHVSFITHML